MVKVIVGQPGIGKTKELIELANQSAGTAKGNVVFIGESSESVLELNHKIRYIDISEYPLDSSTEFLAFLHGLLGGNYDIEKIYLDGILNVYIMTSEEICEWLDKIKLISVKHNIQFTISISITEDTPKCFEPYL